MISFSVLIQQRVGGAMILINNNFDHKVNRIKTDKKGNYIILYMDIQGKQITLN